MNEFRIGEPVRLQIPGLSVELPEVFSIRSAVDHEGFVRVYGYASHKTTTAHINHVRRPECKHLSPCMNVYVGRKCALTISAEEAFEQIKQ